MIWNASRGTSGEVGVLLLLPRLLDDEACPTATVLVSIGLPLPWSPSSSSPRRRTCILMMVSLLRCSHRADILRDVNTFCSEKSHKKARKDQLRPRGGSSLIHDSVKDVRVDVNEGFLLEFHEEDSFSIVDCSQLPH